MVPYHTHIRDQNALERDSLQQYPVFQYRTNHSPKRLVTGEHATVAIGQSYRELRAFIPAYIDIHLNFNFISLSNTNHFMNSRSI
jgi:hypothetical protein